MEGEDRSNEGVGCGDDVLAQRCCCVVVTVVDKQARFSLFIDTTWKTKIFI